MTEKRKLLTTRSLPTRTAAPAPDPETRPKPILSNKLKLRPPDIPRERLPKAIDRSGEKKVMLTTHIHLAPKEKAARAEAGTPVTIGPGNVASLGDAFVGQAVKPATKGKPRK
jgi:hypothetical protein